MFFLYFLLFFHEFFSLLLGFIFSFANTCLFLLFFDDHLAWFAFEDFYDNGFC